MIMISYQLARPFHFYSINILAALKRLWPKSQNKIYMAWSETIFMLLQKIYFTCAYMYIHIYRYVYVCIYIYIYHTVFILLL